MKNKFFTIVLLFTICFSGLMLFSTSSEAACSKNADGSILVKSGQAKPFALTGTTTYDQDQCSEEPDEYLINFFRVAMCREDPYTAGGQSAIDYATCTDLFVGDKSITLTPGEEFDLLDGDLGIPIGSYSYLVVITDNHLKIKHAQKYIDENDDSLANIFGNASGDGAWCWTLASGITTYTGQTYDAGYATGQGITPVASGGTTGTARLKCSDTKGTPAFATEIIDHFGDDATFVGFADYGVTGCGDCIDVERDTGLTGIAIAGQMLQTDNTIATTEDNTRKMAFIYRYDVPTKIKESTISFKLNITTYASVSIDMAVTADPDFQIFGAKVGGDPFIVQIKTKTRRSRGTWR